MTTPTGDRLAQGIRQKIAELQELCEGIFHIDHMREILAGLGVPVKKANG